jgi:tetratricopeptide (TPR) repeat protein
MKTLILTTFILFSFCSTTIGQTDNKFQDIDALIGTNSMIDAMTAIKKLKENYLQDTLNSEYWIRYSKASYTFYKYEEAKSSIDKAIKLSPNNSVCYFEKGLLLNRIGELETALSALEKAVSINQVGKYYYWKGIVNQQLKKNENAESDYQNALDNKFESQELYNNFAILLSEKEKYEKALVMINKAITLDNKYPQAYSTRSKINFFLLKTDSACIDRSIAIKMGYYKAFDIPDSVCNGTLTQKLQFSADIFAANKLFKQGIIAYSKLIDNNVLKSDYFLNRGYCYYQIKDFEKAEKNYLKALTFTNPALDLIYDNLSLLYYDINNFQKAIEYSAKRIELNPRNHVPYIDRGLCYRKLKKYKEAEKDFNKSLELKPDFFRAFGYRSFLFLELGQYQKSFEDASKSVEINPKYGYGYIVLAQAKQKLGLPDFCIDLYNAKKYGEPDADIGIKEYCK